MKFFTLVAISWLVSWDKTVSFVRLYLNRQNGWVYKNSKNCYNRICRLCSYGLYRTLFRAFNFELNYTSFAFALSAFAILAFETKINVQAHRRHCPLGLVLAVASQQCVSPRFKQCCTLTVSSGACFCPPNRCGLLLMTAYHCVGCLRF